jgi:antitoxin (DNA-binding transcriptional repressor) of toxin-antitoxin stability system
VERTGQSVEITRRGKVVAHLEPARADASAGQRPWERLRVLGGRLRARPEESVLSEADFEAGR